MGATRLVATSRSERKMRHEMARLQVRKTRERHWIPDRVGDDRKKQAKTLDPRLKTLRMTEKGRSRQFLRDAQNRREVLRVARDKLGITEEGSGRRRYSEAPTVRIMRLMAAANSGRSASITLQTTSRSISR